MGRLGIAKTKAKILPNQGEHMELDYARETWGKCNTIHRTI